MIEYNHYQTIEEANLLVTIIISHLALIALKEGLLNSQAEACANHSNRRPRQQRPYSRIWRLHILTRAGVLDSGKGKQYRINN